MKKELIVQRDPKSPISEIFRTLRTNIQFMTSSKNLKTLLVTSTLPGEGKSWTAANLAITFAQAGKKVILVDSDMRKGRLYHLFGVSPKPGLSNYLSGMDENMTDIKSYIRNTEVDNLFFIPAGSIPPNPSELLVSERATAMIEDLKAMSDVVIFDGTPSLLVTDAIILSRFLDATIIVSAYNETKIEHLDKVKKAIENVGGKIAGVVFNKVPITSKKYEDSYYYGSKTERMESASKMNRNRDGFNRNSSNKASSNREKMNERPRASMKEKNIENRNASRSLETSDLLKQINSYLNDDDDK